MSMKLFDDDEDPPADLPLLEPDLVLDDDGLELARTPQALGTEEITADFPWAKGLTYMQTLFVMAYTGDTVTACRSVGCSRQAAGRWLKCPKIRYALRERLHYGVAPELIASRDERLAFWTRCVRDDDLTLAERLKASELLGKANADFSEKRIIEGAGGGPVAIQIITGVPDPEPINITPTVEEPERIDDPIEDEEDDY
jgi:hypothetical protein